MCWYQWFGGWILYLWQCSFFCAAGSRCLDCCTGFRRNVSRMFSYHMLAIRRLDESWSHTVFTMLPKGGRCEKSLKIEFKQRGWNSINTGKRETFLNRYVSLTLRLIFFESITSPAIVFGLATVPVSATHCSKLDILRRKTAFNWRLVS